jgi:hypothetical protein
VTANTGPVLRRRDSQVRGAVSDFNRERERGVYRENEALVKERA